MSYYIIICKFLWTSMYVHLYVNGLIFRKSTINLDGV